MRNLYLPHLTTIKTLVKENPDTWTFELEFQDPGLRDSFSFRPGQFGLLSAFGAGESTLTLASGSLRRGSLDVTFRRIGRVTGALAILNEGETVGFRGPYGNRFPMESFRGKNLLFIAGGIGLPAVTSVLYDALENRGDYGTMTILYGARSSRDLVYKKQISEWEKRPDVNMVKTVDPWGVSEGWDGMVGLVPAVLEQINPPAKNAAVIMCGPPVMIKFSLQTLEKLGFSSEQVYLTLENKMKCGLGKCGRCNIGDIYICKEGPVYTAAEIQKMFPDF
ncbi:MAG: FAD/NAD(P)-binding protein [Nitrospirae bacterium]|nr:FAD/NAD(P)-binding protein [Nitrospirota bacterium]